MTKIPKAAASAMAAAMLATTTFAATSGTANAAERGVDIGVACANQHPGTVAKLIAPYNAYSWRCVTYSGAREFQFSVDINRECQRKYRTDAYLLNGSTNPYAWRCN